MPSTEAQKLAQKNYYEKNKSVILNRTKLYYYANYSKSIQYRRDYYYSKLKKQFNISYEPKTLYFN